MNTIANLSRHLNQLREKVEEKIGGRLLDPLDGHRSHVYVGVLGEEKLDGVLRT